ncbi:hypothetical protein D5018_09195 [Parashewanella curva]|uniref:Pathogenicity island effector protein n=1 Tax=Parashewanella curva TaxID=2338552 RepID=A0A3L8PYP7_9GAMM|nr:hypothetical protein [Parashewanella curva]RLV59969.1 hypothetical protein D5018_09195 [Parashewanella curva]
MSGVGSVSAGASSAAAANTPNVDEMHKHIDDLGKGLDGVDKHMSKIHKHYANITSQMKPVKNPKHQDDKDLNDLANESVDDKNYDTGSLDGSASMEGAAAIEEINQLMIKLADLFKKLRNILQDFNVVQDKLAWDITLASMAQKRDGIEHAMIGMAISGAASIAGGLFSVGFGLGGAAKGSEALGILGQGLGRMTDGAGSSANAWQTQVSENAKLIGSLDETNANTYMRKLGETMERARRTSTDMVSLLVELTQLHRSLENALSVK